MKITELIKSLLSPYLTEIQQINVLGVLLTSSSGTGGSGMGMSKGAWREERSVMQKSSS